MRTDEDGRVAIAMSTPGDKDELGRAVQALAGWQVDGSGVPLHPGDLGWHRRHGPSATAAAVRTWHRDGDPVAVGLVDGGDLLRLGVAPEVADDVQLARRLAGDVVAWSRVEARSATSLREVLLNRGWTWDESWTPLVVDLTGPVAHAGLRVETIGPDHALDHAPDQAPDRAPGLVADRVAVHRSAFERSTFSAEAWHEMAAGPAYARARCLVGYDPRDVAVATATVWSAGTGRPGLLEPVGVAREQRGRGHGTAISRAAAAELRAMGASQATVCTPSANRAAVATYTAAGFTSLPASRDLRRPRG